MILLSRAQPGILRSSPLRLLQRRYVRCRLGQECASCSSCSDAFHMGWVKAVHSWIERQPFMGVILVFPLLPDSAGGKTRG